MTHMSRDQIERWDLLRAAIHEAAHAIVDLRTGGLGGQIELYRVEEADLTEFKIWVGRFTGWRIVDRVAVGLAGVLAELIHDEGGPDSTTETDIAKNFTYGIDDGVIELSDTDAEMHGDYCYQDVERTVRLLFDHWSAVSERAEWERTKALELSKGQGDLPAP